MKKKKIKNKKILIFLLLVCIILIGFILRFVIFNNSTNKYGNRLDTIKNIKVSSKEKDSLKETIENEEKASNVSINIQGKIINVIYTISDDASKDDAKNISNKILEKLSDEIKNAYDIQVFVNKKNPGDSTDFPMIGYKNTKSNKFVW